VSGAFWACVKRDAALVWQGGGALSPVGFFLGASTLLPLAMGPERALLAAAGPPLIWVTGALAALMMLERLFQADVEDGGLDQLLLSPAPLELIVLAKGVALWLTIGLPLALASAPAAMALQAPPSAIPVIVAAGALGMAGFFAIGLLGAALAAGIKRGGVLIALIVLPFFAPMIIFGADIADGADMGPPFLMLAGCVMGALAIGPIAAAAALRLHAD